MFANTLTRLVSFGLIILALFACSEPTDITATPVSSVDAAQQMDGAVEVINQAYESDASATPFTHITETDSRGDNSAAQVSLSENNTETVAVSDVKESTVPDGSPASMRIDTATIADTIPPTVPANPRTIIPPSVRRVYLAWDASTDNVALKGYRVFRDGVILSTVTKRIFADRAVSENTIYQYAIQAFDDAGNTATSASYTVNTPPPYDVEAPSPPGNVQFSLFTNAQATIAWNASTDNTGISGYRVYRNTILIASTASTYYTDLSVTADTAYNYYIMALDDDGNYAVSEPLELYIPPLNDKTAVITWTNPIRNEDESCTTGIERVLVSSGVNSGDYTQADDINLATDALCLQADYDSACNMPVESCQYRTAALTANTWHFVLQARDRFGLLSGFSNEITASVK